MPFDLGDRLGLSRVRRKIPKPVPVTPTPVPVVPPPVVPAGPTAAEIRATNIAKARQKATHEADMMLRSQGLNLADYMPQFTSELDRAQGYLGESEDPMNAFGPDIISSLLAGEQAKRYQQFSKEAQGQFGEGFENRDITPSILDDTINSILESQRGDALQYLERGKARGIYNDVGYGAGLASIGDAYSAGRSDLGSLGGTVIDKYRSQADAIGDKVFDTLSTYKLGDEFSLDPYVSQYQGILSNARSNAGGDLRNLLGGKNYFDLPKLTQRAGQAQGALNLRDADVATALAERKRRSSTSRGLGSQGAF